MPAPRRILLPMLALIALGIAVHGWILGSARTRRPRCDGHGAKTWRERRTAHY